MDIEEGIVAEFLVESHEGLDRLEADLEDMADEPGSAVLLSSVFRTVHTLKGTSGFLGLPRLEALAHAAEDLLVRVRDGRAAPSSAHARALRDVAAASRGVLEGLEATGEEPDHDHSALLDRLTALADEPGLPPIDPSASLGEILVSRGVATQAQVGEALVRQRDGGDTRPLGEILVSLGASRGAIDAALHAQAAVRRSAADSTVRVEVELLDSLIRVADQLGLAGDAVGKRAAELGDADLHTCSAEAATLAQELRRRLRRTLVRPIATTWARVPRMVRDVAELRGREVRLELEGGETEVDVSVLEAVRDPLTHLVRNAVDHGIEPPEVREAAGKPRTGVVRVAAWLEGSSVVIEVSDDGAGIDVERLGRTAVERGLVDARRLAEMDDDERRALALEPGLSTARQVDTLSGRGVGMDVVRAHVERIGGTVRLLEPPRGGTTVRLTVAVPRRSGARAS